MKNIKIGGKELVLAFNMATWLAYEESTGNNIREDLQGIYDDLKRGKMGRIMQVAYLELATSNIGEKVEYEEFLRSIDTKEKMEAIVNDAAVEMMAFLAPQDKMLSGEQKPEEGKAGKEKKRHQPTKSTH